MIERMPSSSAFPEHVYIGYLAREKKDGELTCKPFHVKATSFKKAKHRVETDLVDRPRRVPAPGVLVYMQRTPHELIAANNVKAFFTGPTTKDVCVGKIVTRDGVSQVVLEPKKAAKPRKLRTKNFLAYCLVGESTEIPFGVPATGYMKARERVLRLAAAMHHDLPSLTMSFHIRRYQFIEAGQSLEELLRTRSASECLVQIKKGTTIIFPNHFNPKFRPNQRWTDEKIFKMEKLDRLVLAIKAELAPLLEKARRGAKSGA